MEVINDLVGYENLKIIQNTEWFSFSLDSVLLPNFVTLNPSVKKIIDLGTGNAPIPLILSTKTNANIVAVELQTDLYDLAVRTVEMNDLSDRIEVINEDIKNLKELYQSDTFDVITCNPPYFKYNNGEHVNEDIHKTIARHEKCINLEEIIKVSKAILKNDGVFAMVHRSERLIEIVKLLSENNFEVKKIQFVYSKPLINAEMVLIEARKNGKVGLKVLKPIYVYDEKNEYTDEVKKIFKGE